MTPKDRAEELAGRHGSWAEEIANEIRSAVMQCALLPCPPARIEGTDSTSLSNEGLAAYSQAWQDYSDIIRRMAE